MADKMVVGYSAWTWPISKWDGNPDPNAIFLFGIQGTFIIVKE